MTSQLIILGCDDDMAALQEIFAIIHPETEFRYLVNHLLETIIDDCYVQSVAAKEVEVGARTNWYLSKLTVLPRYPYHGYIVHVDGGVDISDQRRDKRPLRAIVASLATHLREQLAGLKLYDHHGNLTVKLSSNIPWETLAIVLEKL